MTPRGDDNAVTRGAGAARRALAGMFGTHAGPIFVIPSLLIYLAFTAYPVFRTFENSIFTIKPNGLQTYVGLEHFRSLLLTDMTFWRSVGNTLTWSLIEPIVDVGLGLVLALMLYAKVPFARFLRVVWFTPVLISTVVVAIMWMWIYNYDWGALNQSLRWLGLDTLTRPWLGDPSTALWALMLAESWKWVGFNIVVCLAAVHSLPNELLEAAELDNCGWFAKLVFIVVPMLRTTLLNLLILAFVSRMKVFDLVWVSTRGGPMWSTETVSTYLFKRAFEWRSFDLGYPSAIAVVWFAVVLASVFILGRLFRQREKLEF